VLASLVLAQAFRPSGFSRGISSQSRALQMAGRQGGGGGTPPPPMNTNIKEDQIRLIVPAVDDDGNPSDEMEGIVATSEALQRAVEMNLDLVMINENADPPVCKIIDYGKYKYAMEKKKKENIKKQVKSEIKEVKMSYKIEQHDFDVRMARVQRFLSDGDRVSRCCRHFMI
jgi:translation initiation factor IF-3